jgi:hypothetical protein
MNGNSTIWKFRRFCTHIDIPHISLSNKDQESWDKLKLPPFMKEKKSKSPTLPSNPSRSSTNYKKPTVEIYHIDIE